MKIHADRVKKLRMEKQWSQEQLSEICGLNLRTIQRLENSGNASMESVRALAAVFNIDPNELMVTEQVEKPLTPIDVIKTCFIKYADFSGTATRFEYWWFLLFMLLSSAIATVIHEKAYLIVSIIMLLPFLAAGSRRLNDVGRSVWWQLMFLAPFGFVPVFFLMAEPSKANSAGQPSAGSLDAT